MEKNKWQEQTHNSDAITLTMTTLTQYLNFGRVCNVKNFYRQKENMADAFRHLLF